MAYSIKAGNVVLTPDKGPDELKTVWDVVWSINERKDDQRLVGNVWFNSEPERGVVEIDFNIEPEFREKEYAREMLRAIVDWVFKKKGLYEIKMTVDVEDRYKIDALEHAGFVFRMGNKEVRHFSIVKARTAWSGLYLMLGFVVGLLLGLLFNNMIMGIAIGVVVGLVIGIILDIRANMDRSNITGEKKSTHRKAVLEIENDESDEVSVAEVKSRDDADK